MKNNIEIWKPILNFESLYQVSNFGRIKSLNRISKYKNSFRTIKGRVLKFNKNKNGYLYVSLSKNGKVKKISVHKLVAENFMEHKSCGYKLVIDHINHIKTDNRVENLQIITNRENTSKRNYNYSSIYTGVSWDKVNKNWRASIKINGITKNLGGFDDEISAKIAYENKIKQLKT